VRPVRVDLIRPDDLLNLSIEAVNMRVDSSDPTNAVLAVEDAEQPARLIVTFPPQTIAESAYFEWSDIDPELPQGEPDPDAGKTSNDTEDLPPPGTPGNERARVARLARPSRLVFEVPADARLPFTVEGLLDWSKLDLGVSPLAAIPPSPKPEQIAGAPAIREPKGLETALELPYRLWISPGAALYLARAHGALAHAARRAHGRRHPGAVASAPGAPSRDLVAGLPPGESAWHGCH
jgi:hypothetical protein